MATDGIGHPEIMPKSGCKVASPSAIMNVTMRIPKAAFPLLILLLACCAYGLQNDTLSEAQIREIVRQSADKDVENTLRERDYTYVRRNEERKLDGKGRVKSTESKTYEIMVLAGERLEKLIAKDDKPLSEKEARKEDEKVQKVLVKSQKETERDRRKRLEKTDKETEEARLFVKEIADAYTFRFLRTEDLGGRPTYVIDADPRPGYKPRIKDAKFLPKVRFRAWIDKAESQWVKLDIECIDTISWGLFLARLHKGSTIHIEQTRVNDEVWLPKRVELRLDARIALLKKLDMELDVTFRDYQKFQTNATIQPLGEAPEQR